MKKIKLQSLAIAAILLLPIINSSASVTINLGMGDIYNNSAATTPATSGILNIFAKTSGTWGTDLSAIAASFANLTDSFTPSGSVLLGNLTISSGLAGPSPVVFNLTGGVSVGQELLAVVYPTISSSSTMPGVGTLGFVYRTSQILNFSDIAWVVPADGATFSLNALTAGQGGTLSNIDLSPGSSGGFTTVPEPSTYALLAVGAVGLFLSFRRRKVQA